MFVSSFKVSFIPFSAPALSAPSIPLRTFPLSPIYFSNQRPAVEAKCWAEHMAKPGQQHRVQCEICWYKDSQTILTSQLNSGDSVFVNIGEILQ